MKIAVLGTGMVGNTIGTKLVQLGHQVQMGSRSAGNAKAQEWADKNGSKASAGIFEEAVTFGELVFLATKGDATLDVIQLAKPENFKGKIVIDITNPLDFSKGMPPFLIPELSNTNSLGEEVQKQLPDAWVVKTLNTMNCETMVNPSNINGDSDVFLSGNSEEAKTKVTQLLQSFGWKSFIDLGDISTARGTEQLLPIWVRLYGALQTPYFNFRIVK